MNKIFTLIMTLLLATLFIPILLNIEKKVQKVEPPKYEDCEEIVSVPIIGIRRFAFCPTDSTVWSGDMWVEPTSFEWRLINKMEMFANDNNLTAAN